jgi:N-acetyl-gamma-glutamyl-phosphate reductase
MTSVYILGGSGYTGGELLRILENHPKVDEVSVSSTRYAGKSVKELHPYLTNNIIFEEYDRSKANDSDFVFTCTPHTKAMEYAKELETKIVDLSADFRLKNYKVYEDTYQVKHTAKELIAEAVYGLPELHRGGIKRARVIANPGCLATGAILALWPLVKNFKVDNVVIDSKTGYSGAGREPKGDLIERVVDNLIPYKIGFHRHVPEMEQELGIKVHFTPHVFNVFRGIITTVHAFGDWDLERIEKAYNEAYKGEPFTKVIDGVPSLQDVNGNNDCHVGAFTKDSDRLIVVSAIDNLVKGASGAAVQNMNIMAGFKETDGFEGLGKCQNSAY